MSPEDLLKRTRKSWPASRPAGRNSTRLNRGIPDEDVAMCVGCMAMVRPLRAESCTRSNPLNIRDRSVIINSVWGLPKAVVDGSVDPDVFVVSREPQPMAASEKQITAQRASVHMRSGGGFADLDLTGDKAASPSIADEQALALASMALRLEDYYGSPQDIEWAVDSDGSFYVLQCRPLQQLSSAPSLRTAGSDRTMQEAFLTRGGVTASPGVASGPVFVVKSDVDKLKFPEGAVLVTAQSLPRWAPLLSRAAAVVTELGGVAGHLANVAREFGVPALFGVPGATEILKDGELVTVDADGLTVYRGRVEALLASGKAKKNLMEGSPVYRGSQDEAAAYRPPEPAGSGFSAISSRRSA